mmetsp:Transcript_7833/g.19415  ORF Transcript_7833/g.19415 Transcript_7833/m.19415 type:complete len:662 (-) Transcript_7833:205-2190(-)|eukprot:CAMPEP_0181134530 /NCGR_PEP_ID=MMETSP1071-20121207/32137_1 /TAXON_ID=35127 /ORGANISM="Thalassiosira sp., Strain NH16" /LENGTH=661 /DNA_ID=CAMNT_0023221055 /DNA_START=56 /DNA_END=2041 /DNA_ORIENTATION=-
MKAPSNIKMVQHQHHRESAVGMHLLLLLLSSSSLFFCDCLLLAPPPTTNTNLHHVRERSSSSSILGYHASYSSSPFGGRRIDNLLQRRQQRRRTTTRMWQQQQGGGGTTTTPQQPPPPQSQQPQGNVDDAETLPMLMTSLWRSISFACENMQKGQSATIMFPKMSSKLSEPTFVAKLMAHLDACKDVCDNFGVNTVLVPCVEPTSNRVQGFTVKSYRNPYNTAGTYSGDASQMRFAPDPFWDDEEEWDFGGEDDDVDEQEDGLPQIVNAVPQEDDVVVDLSKKWVDRMMADLALCPFTKSATRSGIPLGPVHYQVDRVTTMEDAYAAYWSEVRRIERVEQHDISTTLQVLPEFCANSVELFEQWADTLTGTLDALEVEDLLQLIFFHPQWTFRDGGDRSGAGLAANYARRSPWPMVNILRTKQVRVAQKGIPTGLVYQQNEKTLGKIGTNKLETMLRLRDWSDVEGMKVDRKDMEALRVANDLQVQGAVKDEDTSFAFDSTPAANKVDRSEIDSGDMVNVILQALEIRLGTKGVASAAPDGATGAVILNGAQASAAMMASDFLLEELSRIAEESSPAGEPPQPTTVLDVRENVDDSTVLDVRKDVDGSFGTGRPSSAMASGGYAASYGFDASEYDDEEIAGGEDAEMSAMWGGGITVGSED